MSQKAAGEFLDRIDKDRAVKAAVREAVKGVVEVGKKHGHKFTAEELEKAVTKKWGKPVHRAEHDEPFTCFFSEAPGR